MRSKIVETLIVITLIPVFPVVVTWYLPWEKWVPKWIPKKVIGPYLVYCAFGAWYFALPTWSVVIVAVFGIGVTVSAFSEARTTSSK